MFDFLLFINPLNAISWTVVFFFLCITITGHTKYLVPKDAQPTFIVIGTLFSLAVSMFFHNYITTPQNRIHYCQKIEKLDENNIEDFSNICVLLLMNRFHDSTSFKVNLDGTISIKNKDLDPQLIDLSEASYFKIHKQIMDSNNIAAQEKTKDIFDSYWIGIYSSEELKERQLNDMTKKLENTISLKDYQSTFTYDFSATSPKLSGVDIENLKNVLKKGQKLQQEISNAKTMISKICIKDASDGCKNLVLTIAQNEQILLDMNISRIERIIASEYEKANKILTSA